MSDRSKPPLVKLRAQLLKPEARDLDSIIQRNPEDKQLALSPDLDFEGRLFVAKPSGKTPDWFGFAQQGIDEELDNLQNRSNAAVLLIKRQERLFAFPFGFGRHRIDNNLLEPAFGLRSALNVLEPSSLRSVDSMNFEDQTVHTRTQTSRASALESFAVDIDRDIVRSVTGVPKPGSRLHAVTGNEETLVFSARIRFDELGELCDYLLELFAENHYRQHFPWIDNVQRVKDPETAEMLDALLLEDFRSERRSAHLAPPTPIEWEVISGFEFTHSRGKLRTDLDLSHYVAAVPQGSLTIENLKNNHKVFAVATDGVNKLSWPIYKCISFETTYDKRRYFLSNGHWFELNNDFATDIRNQVAKLPVADIALPPLFRYEDGKLEHEPDYNKRVNKEIPSIALLDGKQARCRGTSTGVEPCDLLTEAQHIIHVKHRRGGSSSLSHLFAQARISSEALLQDAEFREDVRKALRHLHPEWESRIPAARPQANDYHIVIAVLGLNSEELKSERGLPFFSQVNLCRTVRSLRTLGFKVSILGIEPVDIEGDGRPRQAVAG